MMEFCSGFWSDDRGQGMAEYALILGLVSVVAVLALTNIGTEIVNVFDAIVADLQTAPTT